MTITKIILFIAAAMTFITLMLGVFGMSIGGKFNKKYSNKLMTLRVVFQLATILLVALYAYLKSKA